MRAILARQSPDHAAGQPFSKAGLAELLAGPTLAAQPVAPVAGAKVMATPLMQWRLPVGGGPSSKTWP